MLLLMMKKSRWRCWTNFLKIFSQTFLLETLPVEAEDMGIEEDSVGEEEGGEISEEAGEVALVEGEVVALVEGEVVDLVGEVVAGEGEVEDSEEVAGDVVKGVLNLGGVVSEGDLAKEEAIQLSKNSINLKVWETLCPPKSRFGASYCDRSWMSCHLLAIYDTLVKIRRHTR